MTTKLSSSCFYAVSSTRTYRYAAAHGNCSTLVRFYVQPPQLFRKSSDSTSQASNAKRYEDLQSAPKSILKTELDDIANPPLTTLPPPLNVPENDGRDNFFMYWFHVGRAYGTFYKNGLKAVWNNSKAARDLRNRLVDKIRAKDAKLSTGDKARKHILPDGGSDVLVTSIARHALTRSEYQLLQRNRHDIGKLPFFGLLVLVFGEWLPLVVPFIPGAVPGTCRIPKQTEGMSQKAMERRRASFRQGITEPSYEQLTASRPSQLATADNDSMWPLAELQYIQVLLSNLREDQLLHLSMALDIHNRLWDRLQLAPPSFLLRRGLTKRLQYLALDDILLLRCGGASKLAPAELAVACGERGLDVLGRRDKALRDLLTGWLQRQQEDSGRGVAVIGMLFRR